MIGSNCLHHLPGYCYQLSKPNIRYCFSKKDFKNPHCFKR